MDNLPFKLLKKLRDREAGNALRVLKAPENLIDFSSNDYLGFARAKSVYAWADQLVCTNGTLRNGATGSRLLTGNYRLFGDLEELLQQLHDAPALVFNSGYDANIGFFATIPQRGDVVFFDEQIHASIRDGIRMGVARSYKFRHNDLDDLKQLCRQIFPDRNGPNAGKDGNCEVYVVTESVFSMDGDSPDLQAFAAFCKDNGFRLVVDEAHATGIFGRGGNGLMPQMNLHGKAFARIVTFGKAMGVHGAAVIGSMSLKDYLLNFARSFIYTTGMPPHSVAGILAAHHYLVSEGGENERKKLFENIEYFRQQVASLKLQSYFTDNQAAIHCCQIPGNSRVKEAADFLRRKGFDIRPILAPTVPKGSERLRFCLHSYNTKNEIQEVLGCLANYLGI